MYPNLASQLEEIYSAMQPPTGSDGEIQRRLTGRPNPAKQWNRERGVENGREALDRARQKWGSDGEGVREYGELVLRLVRGVDAEEAMRREMEREERRVVEALLGTER
jgi:hypothetical protein